MAALAPGLHRVLQAAGLYAGATSKAKAAREASEVAMTMDGTLSTQATQATMALAGLSWLAPISVRFCS